MALRYKWRFSDEVSRMTRRYELTDEQYELIRDLLPANGHRGRQWNDHRTTLNGIFWILHSGAQWREMPERYGKWQSVYDRFNRWRTDGTVDRMLQRLQMRLDKDGRIDWDLWCIDGTNVRASRSAAGARESKTTRTNRRITRRAAAGAGGAANSTWLLTARECPWPLKSRLASAMRASMSSR
jgi:transposase